MLFRLFGSLLALCLPVLAMAQTPTITITPTAGAGIQSIFSQKECTDNFNTDTKIYTVKIDFGVSAPLPGTKLTVKLGDTCADATRCLTLIADEALSLVVTDKDILLSTKDLVEASGETACEGPVNGIDQQLTLFVEVVDSLAAVTKKDTGDNEDTFLDTIKPLAPLNPKASGGEGTLNTSWETNPENDNAQFKLEQEASFRVECRLTGTTDFSNCGTANAGIFKLTVDTLNGVTLENGISLDFQVLTLDTAGNESEPSLIAVGTPQDVLDFGENFNGAEQGGCAVGHGEGQLLWVGFLIVVISLLRRSRNEAQI